MKKLKFNKKLFAKQLEYIAFTTLFILYFFGLIGGTALFYIGFHNFDSGHNLNWINCDAGKDYVDFYKVGGYHTGYEMVTNGANQMQIGFFMSLVCMFQVALMLTVINKKGAKNG